MFGRFIQLWCASLVIGCIIGFIGTRIFKKIRENCNFAAITSRQQQEYYITSEIILICVFGYLAYSIGNLVYYCSDIICMFTCALFLAHYGRYNLTPQG
jgi:NhaP-type Na+/H+ or K+/H+ antiporter